MNTKRNEFEATLWHTRGLRGREPGPFARPGLPIFSVWSSWGWTPDCNREQARNQIADYIERRIRDAVCHVFG